MTAKWERFVADYPEQAARSGPPSHLVVQRAGEDFLAAARRVRKEYGLDSVTKVRDETPNNVTVCDETSGVTAASRLREPREGDVPRPGGAGSSPASSGRPKKYKSRAAQQKAYRGRKND